MNDTAPETPAVDPALSESRKAARKRWLTRLAATLVVIALAWGVWYLLIARNFVSTDNAYVNAQMAQVTPLVAGSATEVLVRDTQQVKAGDVLVRLDQADARIALAQAEADLATFEERCRNWPLVRECHMLNGEIDFILKCVAPDLSTFQSFLTGELLKAENVSTVKTSLVIRCAKDEPGVPFDVLEARLARSA